LNFVELVAGKWS
jgi:hypothetical protein